MLKQNKSPLGDLRADKNKGLLKQTQVEGFKTI
jgi:hypothetical protein